MLRQKALDGRLGGGVMLGLFPAFNQCGIGR
jgi:hypothetical protein